MVVRSIHDIVDKARELTTDERRSRIDFETISLEAFAFLQGQFGMNVLEHGPTRVVYSDSESFVAAYWGRLSYEVGASIGTWVPSGEISTDRREIPIPFLFDVLHPNKGHLQPTWIASSQSGVKKGLTRLADQTRTVIAEVRSERLLMDDAYLLWDEYIHTGSDQYLAAPIRRRADQAWHAHDYAAVVHEYEMIRKKYSRAELKPSELARLRYAAEHDRPL